MSNFTVAAILNPDAPALRTYPDLLLSLDHLPSSPYERVWAWILWSFVKHALAHMSESDVLCLVRTAHDGQSIHTLSSAVWLLYDLLTTFDQEVEFVWRSANTLPKFLYLVSRYVGIFGQFALASGLLPAYCNGQLITSLILDSCLILSVELSLMLRIDALYGRSKKVRTLLLVAFAVEAATAAAINGIIYPRIYAESRPFPSNWPLKGCFFPTDIFWNKLCWAPILAFETLLFCLNTAKCISYGRLEQTPLIYRLFRDGSAYFAIAFAFMLVCIITQFLDVSWASSATSTWISAVFSYSGCHLLLSVRSVATRRERLDLTLLCAHASDTHNGHKSDSYLDGPYAIDPPQPCRPSFPHRIDSIELIPRPTFVDHGSECTSEEQTEESTSRYPRSEGQSNAVDVDWLEQGKGRPSSRHVAGTSPGR